ncbi:MAG TPA: site-specific integrase [Pirellulales bacterium]|nr:site-specific integrase [Pirellulales bacterium]
MSKRIPRLCLHRPSGRYFVRFNGQAVYLGTDRRKARTEADRLIAEWLARRRQPAVQASDLTVTMLVARFRDWADDYFRHPDGRSTGHVEAHVKPAMRYLRKTYGTTMAAEFGPLRLEALRMRMIDDGLSRRYVNGLVAAIKRCFKWAVSKQLLPVEVHAALSTLDGLRIGKSKARECEPIAPVPDEVVEQTLARMQAIPADMVRLQRLTGARPDEVCRLRPYDIDRSGDVWVYTPPMHKTAHRGHKRRIFIGPKGQEILRPYLLRPAEAFCFSPAESEAKRRAAAHERRITPEGYGNNIGTSRKRRPKRQPRDHYTVATYRRAIHRACDRLDAELVKMAIEAGDHVEGRLFARWSPNRLRHTAATEIRKRFGLEHAQVALGHSNADVTQIYAERDMSKGIEVARIVG